MLCPTCGSELLEGSRFCRQCGAPVAGPAGAQTDAELEALAATGDREAFAELYNRHFDRVYDFLRRMLRDRDEAADLAQETFLRAMRALSPKETKAGFSTWLFAIARNLALKRLERQRRLATLPEREGEEPAIFHQVDPDRLANPAQAAEAGELSGLVWQAAAALSPKEYSLLDLHVRQGLDSAEIAQVLGVSKGNAYTMMSRLKDSFEGAVAGLFMLRQGRWQCPELNHILEERSIAELSPAVRRLIERHTGECATCQEQRRKLVSPANILGALVPVALPLAVKQRMAEAALASWVASGTQAAEAGLTGLLSQSATKLASLSAAWKAVLVGGLLIMAVGGGLGGWVGLGGALPGEGGNQTPGATASDEKGAEELAQALEDLKQAMLKKLDFDVDNTALSFASVKDYWRAKRWADILTAPLRVLEDTLALVAKATDVKDLATEVNAALDQSEAAYQVLSVVMMVQGLQEAGGQLQYGLFGPTYVAAVEEMLDAADAVNAPLSFDQDAYKRVIANHLYGGFEDLPGPLVVPRRSTTAQRKNVQFARGALEVRTSIARTFNELITDVKGGELPEGFPVEAVVAQLKDLKTQVVNSMGGDTTVHYEAHLLDGHGCTPYEVETNLGAISDYHRAFGQVAGAVADNLAIQQRVEVLKLMQAGESAALVYTVAYGIPGVKEEIRVAQKATVLSDLIVGSYNRTFYPSAEEAFYMLPQEMVLGLPMELSNLWMIADDTDQHIRCLLGTTQEAKPTPTPSATTAVIGTPTRTARAGRTPSPTATSTAQPTASLTGMIAFTSDRDGNSEIYLMDAHGDNQVNVTNNAANDWEPAWSPDGRRIAFVSDRDGDAEIYVMDLDGTNLRQLTFNSAAESEPDWSPDGSHIIFCTNRDGNDEIYIMDADGGNQVNLTQSSAPDQSPRWSPDGGQIVFTSQRGDYPYNMFPVLYTMNPDGSEVGRLPLSDAPFLERWVATDWSPDGANIAFTKVDEGIGGYSEMLLYEIGGEHAHLMGDFLGKDRSGSFSPDGRWLCFASARKDNNWEIYALNLETKDIVRLTENGAGDWDPAWSPSSTTTLPPMPPPATSLTSTPTPTLMLTPTPTPLLPPGPGPSGRIAFESDRDGNGEVYVMNADGSGQTNLSRNPADDGWPNCSTDGSRIAFVSYRDGNGEIYVMNADGSGQTRLTNDPAWDYGPVWSPDGSLIAFVSDRTGSGDIYVMNADGTGQTRLTTDPASDYDPAWSPDGSLIALVSNRTGNGDIYVMDADGTGQTRLTSDSGFDHGPTWSPDGSRIAFHSNRDGNFEIYIMKSDGTGQTNLTNNPPDDGSPAWSPDGSWIAFDSNYAGNLEIFVMKTDGSGHVDITNDPADDNMPAWCD
jgi:RNA polymerase sigma factor (sigma-70 family)